MATRDQQINIIASHWTFGFVFSMKFKNYRKNESYRILRRVYTIYTQQRESTQFLKYRSASNLSTCYCLGKIST